MPTKIEWVQNPDGAKGETWNPVVGCQKISPGCANCYACRDAAGPRLVNHPKYAGLTRGGTWTGEVRYWVTEYDRPLRRQKPTTWFVCSMGDLFHEDVPDAWIDDVFHIIDRCPAHTFIILTKRARRMHEYLTAARTREAMYEKAAKCYGPGTTLQTWPFRNAWIGVTAEDQERADERIPLLIETPAWVRWVSVEPMLGEIDIRPAFGTVYGNGRGALFMPDHTRAGSISWVVCGGESGPKARPMNPQWARFLRDQCQALNVPFFFKQWGEWMPTDAPLPDGYKAWGDNRVHAWHCGWTRKNQFSIRVGKKAAGRELDGVVWNQMPRRTED